VTKAVRLICSAPVPGLGGPSYLDVFRMLTCASWEHHIFLFGGLVRDILRRKVGNDVDISFSASATELAEVCRKHGFTHEVRHGGAYIIVGDKNESEYIEGFVITNQTANSQYIDFSMNWLWYDFCNDVIIDRNGRAVPDVMAAKLALPCPREQWSRWREVTGIFGLFRYYKFLLRGYKYDTAEMAYIAERLLHVWKEDAATTTQTGQWTFPDMVSSQDACKITQLKDFVLESFELAFTELPLNEPKMVRRATKGCTRNENPRGTEFLSANQWWQRGWVDMLKLPEIVATTR